MVTPFSREIKLLQFIGYDLQNKNKKIVDFMRREGISIPVVQTKLYIHADLLNRVGFNVLCKNRRRDNGGGLVENLKVDFSKQKVEIVFDGFYLV